MSIIHDRKFGPHQLLNSKGVGTEWDKKWNKTYLQLILRSSNNYQIFLGPKICLIHTMKNPHKENKIVIFLIPFPSPIFFVKTRTNLQKNWRRNEN